MRKYSIYSNYENLEMDLSSKLKNYDDIIVKIEPESLVPEDEDIETDKSHNDLTSDQNSSNQHGNVSSLIFVNIKEEHSNNDDYKKEMDPLSSTGEEENTVTLHIKEEKYSIKIEELQSQDFKTDSELFNQINNIDPTKYDADKEYLDDQYLAQACMPNNGIPSSCQNVENSISKPDDENSSPLFLKNQFHCNECPKTFLKLYSLRSHITKVHKKWECNECHQIFFDNDKYHQHINNVHKRVKQSGRSYCHKMFDVGKHNQHKKNVCKRIKKYECNICHKLFYSLPHLKEHDNGVHKGIKAECEICHKVFSRVASVKTHVNSVHKGIRNFECEICHHKFFTMQKQQEHINGVHKKIKSFECKICHKMFSRSGDLKAHFNIHSEVKDYKCNICHDTFSFLGQLKTHVNKVHLGIKNECPVCNRMFSSAFNKRTHIERVHNKKRNFKCGECQRMCFNYNDLKKHINSVHVDIK